MNWFFVLIVFGCFANGEDSVFQHPVKDNQRAGFDRVSEKLRQIKTLRARFEQEKKIVVLSRPLRSQGNFLFSAEHGIHWLTTRPFENVFIVQKDRIYQKSEGAEPLLIPLEERPAFHEMIGIFLALFSGDTQRLQNRFNLYFQGTDQQWTIGLQPKGKIIRRLVKEIVLTGGATIDTIDLREAKGDRTKISFADISLTPAQLTQEEQAKFVF